MALPAAAVARTRVASASELRPAASPSDVASNVAVADGVGAADTAAARPARAPVASQGAPATRSLPELFNGMRVGRCVVVSVGPIEAGAIPVVLKAPDGSVFGLDILRHDPLAPGVSRAGSLAVFLKNGGSGRTASVEEHGLAAMALGKWLDRREAMGRPVPALLTLHDPARWS
jgi:hypothetical protein